MYTAPFLYYILIFNHLFLLSNKTIVLTISRRTKNDTVFIISVGHINVDSLFNIFSMARYIVLLASNGATIPNIFLLMATKMTEPIQYTMLIPKLIKMLGETILIVPTTKIYCKITSENKIINSK